MLTNNFKHQITAASNKSFNLVQSTGKALRVNNTGLSFPSVDRLGISDTRSNSRLAVGTGGGVERPESYNLEGDIYAVNPSLVTQQTVDNKLIYSFQITNTTQETIVFKEVGIFKELSMSNAAEGQMLLDRTLLSQPVTAEPNQTVSIQYTIDFSNI